MGNRVFPMVVLFVGLGLVLGFMSIPFLARTAPVLDVSETLSFSDRFDEVTVEARLTRLQDSAVAVQLEVTRYGVPVEDAWPQFMLIMPEHDMAPLVPEVTALGEGRFEASKTLPMLGQWVLQVSVASVRSDFRFQLAQ